MSIDARHAARQRRREHAAGEHVDPRHLAGAREPARPLAVQASGSVICSACTAHSLPAVEGERTVLLRSGAVKVRVRRSSRARRLRLVLVPGVGPRARRPRRAPARVRSTARWRRSRRGSSARSPASSPRRSASRGRAWRGTEARRSRCAWSRRSARAPAGTRGRSSCARPTRGRGARARALVPQRSARRARRLDRAPGARHRRRSDCARGARPAHALGLLLVARHALVLVAAAARAGLGAGRRRLPRALPPAPRQPLDAPSGRSSREHRPGADSRPVAAGARRRACRIPAGG